jgi:hypothetical protein
VDDLVLEPLRADDEVRVEPVSTMLFGRRALAASIGGAILLAIVIVALATSSSNVVPSGKIVSSDRRTTIALEHARVTLDAGAEIIWAREKRTIMLVSRAIDVAVDPSAGNLRVVTPKFSVEGVGAKFTVSEIGVSVIEGVVRIRDAIGAIEVERLEAGHAWVPSQPPARPIQVSSSISDMLPLVRPSPHARHKGSPIRGALEQHTPRELLAGARSALVDRNVERARSLLLETRGFFLSPQEDAEASAMEAECASILGDHATAAQLYGEVADRYRDLPTGANALYAEAIEEEALHHASRAIGRLRAYIARYPKGQRSEDVRARLTRLVAEKRPLPVASASRSRSSSD